MPATKQNLNTQNSQKGTSRREKSNQKQIDILKKSANLFASDGYHATSMRKIAECVGLSGGSLYYYIESKEKLFVQINVYALSSAKERIEIAISEFDDPWSRLEVACVELLKIQLDPDSITMPLMKDFHTIPNELRQKIIKSRDEFEVIFSNLINELNLSDNIDKNIYRIFLLTILNSASNWFKYNGRLSIEEIGKQVLEIFRFKCET
ncbi:MAG: TetR family transcriptional regulator [Methyloligella sp.]|nr:MAG: TetR family transcriptional regulator [Methyloligella sp.]